MSSVNKPFWMEDDHLHAQLIDIMRSAWENEKIRDDALHMLTHLGGLSPVATKAVSALKDEIWEHIMPNDRILAETTTHT